jgi:hypothetical protein
MPWCIPWRAWAYEARRRLLGGEFRELHYCTAPPDPLKQAIVAYGHPIPVSNARLIFGNATIGRGLDGAPIVHCHAAFQAMDGTPRGGHIIPQLSTVGRKPIAVLVTSLDDFELRVQFDAETNIPLIQPEGDN